MTKIANHMTEEELDEYEKKHSVDTIDYPTEDIKICLDCRKLIVNCTCEDDAIQNLAEEKHNEQITS